MTNPTPHNPLTADPVGRAVEMLGLLSDQAREQVLGRMDPELAQRVRDRMETMPERPHGDFSRDIAERRRLLREAAQEMHGRRVASTEDEAGRVHEDPAYVSPADRDPLAELRRVHPAALARAMQGERAEAWAIVLDRLDDSAQAALRMYLDDHARLAIESARAQQATLPHLLTRTIERAIATTVVPAAMREHQAMMTGYSGGYHGTAL